MEQRFCVLIEYDSTDASGIVVLLTVLGNPHQVYPGVRFMTHANIKGSLEYQIRRQQIVYDPTTGTLLNKPFCTTATAGLEWVY
jgi:hypothetical protein